MESLGLWTDYHWDLYDPPAEATSDIKIDIFGPPPPWMSPSRSQTRLNYVDEEGDEPEAVTDEDDNVCPSCLRELSGNARFCDACNRWIMTSYKEIAICDVKKHLHEIKVTLSDRTEYTVREFAKR